MTRGASARTVFMSDRHRLSVTGTAPTSSKNRSSRWQNMSVRPAAVWYSGSVNVSSGFMNASFGRCALFG